MFIHSCTVCAKRQLIFPSQIAGVAGAPGGLLSFSFTCWCGAEQTALRGSSSRTDDRKLVAA